MIKKGLNVALMGVLGLAIVGCDGQQKKTRRFARCWSR